MRRDTVLAVAPNSHESDPDTDISGVGDASVTGKPESKTRRKPRKKKPPGPAKKPDRRGHHGRFVKDKRGPDIAGFKYCAECEQWRWVGDFAPRKWWPDGKVRLIQTYCRPCMHRISVRSRQNASEEKKALERERKREWEAQRRRREGIPVAPVGPNNKGKYGAGRVKKRLTPMHHPEEFVLAEAFRPFLEKVVDYAAQYSDTEKFGGKPKEGGITVLARWADVPVERLRRVLNRNPQQVHVLIDIVDAVLLHSIYTLGEVLDEDKRLKALIEDEAEAA